MAPVEPPTADPDDYGACAAVGKPSPPDRGVRDWWEAEWPLSGGESEKQTLVSQRS
jgi:hypothetical protein